MGCGGCVVGLVKKRKDVDRPDRVEGLIESRIQHRMRSRSYDFDR